MDISLPNKYRPLRFEDLVGQEGNRRWFSNLIKNKKVSRAIILYGSYGSSKTTTARIYARVLNCISPTIEGSPCNSCKNCVSFLKGGYVDYAEFDGASNGRIEDIRELVELARTPPLFGKYRVVVIDEAQGLSRQAWDTLLKIIEEPPEHLIFVFTTTEIDKVREAVRSRCHSLPVSLLSHEDSVAYLVRVCKQEGFNYDPKALYILSRVSKGHPRDLLKNLEQCSYYGDIDLSTVSRLFGLDSLGGIVKLMVSLLTQGDIVNSLNTLVSVCVDPVECGNLLKGLFLHVGVKQGLCTPSNPVFEGLDTPVRDRLLKDLVSLSLKHGVELSVFLNGLYKVLMNLRADSLVSLELSLVQIHDYLHKGVGFAAVGVSNPGAKEASTPFKRTGRSFVGTYRAALETPLVKKEEKVAPVEVDTSLSKEGELGVPIADVQQIRSVEQKVLYWHDLLKLGFVEYGRGAVPVRYREPVPVESV